MATELVPKVWDDLDLAEGRKTEAECTVLVGYDGAWTELDLTAAHRDGLETDLLRYLKAGRPASPRARRRSGQTPREYNRGMREFAAARGIRYRCKGGSVYYPKSLREAYAAHLAAQEATSASGQTSAA